MAIINELNKTGKDVTRKVEKTLKDGLKKGQVKSKKIINQALKSVTKNSKQLETKVGGLLDTAQVKLDKIQNKLKTKIGKIDKNVSKVSNKAVKELKSVKKEIQSSKPVKTITTKLKAVSSKAGKPSSKTKVTSDKKGTIKTDRLTKLPSLKSKSLEKTTKTTQPIKSSGQTNSANRVIRKPATVAAKKSPSK